MKHTIRIRAANASNRSIRPESGSPTTLAILIASRAWRQPMIPGTENKKNECKQQGAVQIPGNEK